MNLSLYLSMARKVIAFVLAPIASKSLAQWIDQETRAG
jgi:hypothetical protein